MVTVVTHVRLREGAQEEWDAVFAQRVRRPANGKASSARTTRCTASPSSDSTSASGATMVRFSPVTTVAAARERQGFVFVQLCRTDGDAGERVIVGCWERDEDWESWHNDPEFVETRNELEHAAADGTGDTERFEVLLERRR